MFISEYFSFTETSLGTKGRRLYGPILTITVLNINLTITSFHFITIHAYCQIFGQKHPSSSLTPKEVPVIIIMIAVSITIIIIETVVLMTFIFFEPI
jgi:hypothetical protein